jgi:ATP-binding cassette subfamily F protein 3
MIAHFQVYEKSYGSKILYSGLEIRLNAHEKVGLIGRNGTGKTTLLNIISGTDKDFDGDIQIKRGMTMVASRQEHHAFEDVNIIDYISGDLPEFSKLKHVMDTYPEHMASSDTKMQTYSDALERFGQLGYYEVDSQIKRMLGEYQIDGPSAEGTLDALSGGQKRMVELVKVQRANAHIALIDEPTNHMDYVAKAAFIDWMKGTNDAVIVITHDRDVLNSVDKIIEIRDGAAEEFRGNYDSYLKINKQRMSTQVNEFGIREAQMENLKADVIRFKRFKERARDGGTIAQFKRLENNARDELVKLEALEKPSFWIDQDSAKQLNTKMAEAYSKHKAKNIRISTRTKSSASTRKLIDLKKLSLGYEEPLFKDISFQLREGERIEFRGRNGVGKSTLAKAIVATMQGDKLASKVYDGSIEHENGVLIGVYEQELPESYMKHTLASAIEQTYLDKNIPIGDQKVRQLMGDYLFNPQDAEMPVAKLSGGQKARLQLINMLAGDPAVLLLDEPTNHLDLPSIEELESALKQYHGAIIYISHDSYFTEKLGGTVLNIGS